MTVELKVPPVGESVTEVTIGQWLKHEGEAVERDAPLAVIESEKATIELPAESGGTITKILKKDGETAQVGEVIAILDTDQKPSAAKPSPADATAVAAAKIEEKPPAKVKPAAAGVSSTKATEKKKVSPAPPAQAPEPPASNGEANVTAEKSAPEPSPVEDISGEREEEVVPMTRLRRTVARRLVEAQQTAALLTTFNEIDMSQAMALRKQYGEAFQQRYNTKLGFMSFFVKAVVEALKLVPQVNAEIRGDNIVFKNYYDIAVAIGGGKGLVVPVLRNAERLSFAEIELTIGDFATRAKNNTLKPEELQGGTFTISNGGIYGSLLSTPIVNPPQSGILGMHAIQERPVAREGQVVIRPMMYVALTYDHRLVDGREAVTFLKRVKEVIEEPARLLMEV